MKILVVGGSGFIGSHVSEILSLRHQVFIFDKNKFKNNCKNLTFIKGDILNYNNLLEAIRGKDIVFNFAALADIDISKNKPSETVKINILGSVNIFKACLKSNVKKIIHASTIYVDSNEGNFYAVSKRSAEDYLVQFNKNFNLVYTILRFGSLYGERADDNNGIKKIINNLKKHNRLIYRGSRKAARKYIYVKDAAKACAEVIKKKYDNKCLTITGHKLSAVSKIMLKLKKIFNIKNKIIFLNEKNTSHYNIRPSPYKKIMSKNYIIKNEVNLIEQILKLIKEKTN